MDEVVVVVVDGVVVDVDRTRIVLPTRMEIITVVVMVVVEEEEVGVGEDETHVVVEENKDAIVEAAPISIERPIGRSRPRPRPICTSSQPVVVVSMAPIGWPNAKPNDRNRNGPYNKSAKVNWSDKNNKNNNDGRVNWKP